VRKSRLPGIRRWRDDLLNAHHRDFPPREGKRERWRRKRADEAERPNQVSRGRGGAGKRGSDECGRGQDHRRFHECVENDRRFHEAHI
jgi:hypothetical protein